MPEAPPLPSAARRPHRRRLHSTAPRAGRSRVFGLFALGLALLPALLFWWWQGRPQALPDAPAARVPCVSYAPYQGSQTPFDEGLVIPPAQIERDLQRLLPLTSCVRTYATDQGLEALPGIAERLGMKVMLGVWIGREQAKNEVQIARGIELARRYPETVKAVIVGNEVLLRREQPPELLTAMIARVREAVPVPVTYADVWEFWQKHPEVAQAVDFVTIHTLPYWEDQPTSIDEAVPHVVRIWREMSDRFPGKPVFIGEAGWPSEGRMREGALPSRVNQTRFVREMMVVGEREKIGINLIESFDQPWKRKLEGTVGGYWGLYDGEREPKVPLAGPVRDDPRWLGHFAASAVLALLLLVPAARAHPRLAARIWLALAGVAVGAGVLIVSGGREGLIAASNLYEWAILGVNAVTAVLAAALLLDAFPRVWSGSAVRPAAACVLLDALHRRSWPARPWRETALGAVRAAALFAAAASTLCLVFDPRYRDFAAALYAVPALGFLLLSAASRAPGPSAARPRRLASGSGMGLEERIVAAFLAAGSIALVVRQGLENHQALAWAAMGLAFAAAIFGAPQEAAAGAPERRATATAPSSTPPAEASGP